MKSCEIVFRGRENPLIVKAMRLLVQVVRVLVKAVKMVLEAVRVLEMPWTARQSSESAYAGEAVVVHALLRPESVTMGLGVVLKAVLGIRIRRIRMFLGLLDLDPLVRGPDPDPWTLFL
jgi:hypothetical protein